MKCYTRYMLPLVIAVCMFLGSLFISLDVHAQEKSTDGLGYESYFLACREEVQKVLDGRGYSLDNLYYYGYYDESSKFVKVFLSTQKFICHSYTNSSFLCDFSSVVYEFYISTDCEVLNWGDRSSPNIIRMTFNLDSSSFSNHDILYENGELFFQGPSPFQQAVRGQDWTTVMTEIVIMVPLLIVFLVSLIGLRKGLRFVSSFLHRA